MTRCTCPQAVLRLCVATFLDWSLSIGFALECGGSRFEDIIQGARMNASLGDGKGTCTFATAGKPGELGSLGAAGEQQGILRWMYDSPIYGTCLESLQGGNHYRVRGPVAPHPGRRLADSNLTGSTGSRQAAARFSLACLRKRTLHMPTQSSMMGK